MASGRRLGIIGVGFGAQVHAPAFRSEGWDIVALCSRDGSKARAAADKLGVAHADTDPFRLIARGDIDAVSIAVPPRAHRDLVLAAAAAGKHILCEKPFAMSAEEAAEMKTAVERAGITAMVAHEFRYAPQRAHIKALLDAGHIGAFRLCTVDLFLDRHAGKAPQRASWNARQSEGGGALAGVGSHYIDGLRHWFGEIAAVSGWTGVFGADLVDPASGAAVRSETDDSFSFTLFFANGGIANMVMSLAVMPPRGASIAIMGDAGTLLATQPGPVPVEGGVVLASQDASPPVPVAMPAHLAPFSDPRDHRLMAFRMLVRDFNAGIAAGRSPSPNFDDGLRCQLALDAIKQAALRGRRVQLAASPA
ncbi:MAG TPA: Gfo/Idh/MocA family oxidoreductase [Xanthobacteraceae bacterium]|nr:Gfo/Idh/MocA family oxidoreductase [Xanthobacteraceae bacterium]HVY20303.1 Gfo/Idh/MocA family oxidoreductase [Bauldia sp.]